ncbi:efflux RND transporter permease subunit [Halospeciosus flavus]|uniref:RND family transporter n=1 Tax=Halospeciosus flavus TaxID=3032283 RepID=A0ABD5Z3T5_9EURY|nr:MMPL family transporter [Halospeciosus flavus]
MDYQDVIDRVDTLVVEQPKTVVVACLLLTAVFAVGLGNISTEAGTSQFTEGSPAMQAYEDVQREFSDPFAPDTGSTQLVQRNQNVLSKPSLLRMLTIQKRLAERPGLRVAGTSSVAESVALSLDPRADTMAEKIDAVESATPSQLDAAVREAARERGIARSLSEDFNRESATASATVGVVTHRLPGGLGSGIGASGTSPLTAIQQEAQHVVNSVTGDVVVFGSGMISAEFANVIVDSLIIVVPAAALLIFVFLVFSYRDPFDLFLGVVSLLMTVVWTFGFMGLLGIPFSQMLVAVPPLLLAVGIDFGIHAINRYREERTEGADLEDAMSTTTDQLLPAFFIVTGTTVLGFAANLTSSLGPIRSFGLVAAIGIAFTMVIFGVFLPSGKVLVDRWREHHDLPAFGRRPIGTEGSLLGRALRVGVFVGKRAPRLFLVVVLLSSAVVGAYGTGVDTSFEQDDFLPPADVPDYLENLPEPFKPSDYSSTAITNYLDEHFATTGGGQVVVYVQGQMTRDYALEQIQHANRDPPSTFVAANRSAQPSSIVDVIDAYAAANPEFAALVARNDVDADGVPDDNLKTIYDRLFASPYGERAENYLTPSYRSARVVYPVESGAAQDAVTADAQAIAADYRFDATATGQAVIFQQITDTILESALRSLAIALVATALFLLLVFRLFEGHATVGLVNLVPILLSLALIAGTMRFLGIPLNAMTATILSITIGMGVDYSSHFVHRFADEYGGDNLYEAMEATVTGTGGALTGSMLTTVSGIGVLAIAITPILGQFGVITALSIFYSYLTSIVVTPSAFVVWDDLVGAEAGTGE